jgi:cobalt-zinc-cadmium efflux system outer membrane protein
MKSMSRHVILPTLFAALAAFAHACESRSAELGTGVEQLTLRQAEALFENRNRELRLAQRTVEGAEADAVSAAARPNPGLSIGTSQISPSQGVGSGSPWNKHTDTVIGLSQLIERGNKRELRTGVAAANASASRSDRNEVERQQRYVLYSAYYDLLLAQEKQAISAETTAAYQKTRDASQVRLNAGDIAATDVARISIDMLRAQNDARVARAELTRAQLTLAYLIGAEREAATIRAVDSWPAIEVPSKPADIEKIIEARADVQAARARLAAAERGRELARTLRTRDVTVGVQYERFPGDVSSNSYGFFVSVPLFTNYYYDGEIRKAEAEFGAAQDGLERTQALALAEISRSRSDLESAAERVRRSHDSVLAAADKAAASAEFAYSRGAIGVMDLLDARRQLYAVRLETATVQSDYSKALAAWRASIAAGAAQGQ